MHGKAVKFYEIGNEFDTKCLISSPREQGQATTDYDTPKYNLCRGLVKGMIAGVKSVNPDAQVIVGSSGWLHWGYQQRLWDDGVRWDLSGFHWYSKFDAGSTAIPGTSFGGGYNILELHFAPAAMGADQLNSARGETLPEPLRIISAIANEPHRSVAGPPAPGAGHLHRGQGFFREADFRGRGAKESASQRYTRAVCHHHPLCTFATFGFTHAEPPFLARAKLPSMNTSSQLSRPWASNSERKSRQMLSQMSSSSQSRSRLQQVLAEGYRSGRSRQRAPLRSTHRMPSRTSRSSARGRPMFRSGGRSGWIVSHCESLRSVRSCIPSFPHQSAQSYQHKMWVPKIKFPPPPRDF